MKPSEFGFDFDSFLPGQEELVLRVVSSLLSPKKRFIVVEAPTGIGKTLIMLVAASIPEGRSVFVTSRVALQDQYYRDRGSSGLSLIKGESKYDCNAVKTDGELFHLNPFKKRIHTGIAPCKLDFECSLMHGGGCDRFDAIREAKLSDKVITSYALWLTLPLSSVSVGQFSNLFMDEAHKSIDHLGEFMTAKFYNSWGCPFSSRSLEDWKSWAAETVAPFREYVTALRRDPGRKYDELLKSVKMLRSLESLTKVSGDCGIDEKSDRDGMFIAITPKWPGNSAEELLFRGVSKVVMFSATLNRKVPHLLGVNDFEYISVPSSFDPRNRPIIFLNRSPKVRWTKRTKSEDLAPIFERIREIILSRPNKKGIILPVSYDRMIMIKDSLRMDHLIITHRRADPDDFQKALEVFRKAEPPCVLNSPIVGEGFDFPGDECEYIIIPKIPFVPMIDDVMKKRRDDDPDYPMFLASIALEQYVGRGNRLPTDRCEIFILDASIEWFLGKGFFSDWFLSCLKKSVNTTSFLP